ncbi:iron donor protein CyaY [Psychrosphaera sp. B3R10]|uniref:Iron-sulfur cluster assembly protein CyaY n=1 Tax=Psychrosphaera algicola TaxID=3023714 RepID=A0ABT5FFJ1_9GAMM|nr:MULTISPECIES: iron donor protein CyaY [unclassified Psychrosphaera]MBU2883136.1 iron donor protein CyaY [Psychrosphaera sp. I2R16]MBU2988592.1 iron donor protein CyaY [Psychrosphaera sp. B3R10]MDC2890325.1 iron donor protein CyaY [Psychrosphaera sp. G1-22]MDO6719655.1 iron donor protein CyaY [Psychrosphaera sp. 1_MG-2023]
MNDSEYHQLADDFLMKLQDAVDEVDFDLDYESAGGIVEIIFPNGTKIIVNKQAPLQQLWVATKFNGHHFEYKDGLWIDNRGGSELWALISDAATKQAGEPISIAP